MQDILREVFTLCFFIVVHTSRGSYLEAIKRFAPYRIQPGVNATAEIQ